MKRFIWQTLTLMIVLVPVAFANQETGAINGPNYVGIASILGMSIAVLGGTAAQSKVSSTALEGIGRNPAASDKFIVPMILGLALIESLVIMVLVISFLVKSS